MITTTLTETRIRVESRGGRHQVRTSAGVLRAQRLHSADDRVRLALVGQTALLLGGDAVSLDVSVGSGARLELVEVAGTVAYHGRSRQAGWQVRVRVEAGGRLDWTGEPFVLGDGADVVRTLEVDLATDAVAVIAETLVFGRTGERGGRLDTSTALRRDGHEFCRERWISDAGTRSLPGVLAGAKRLDSVLSLGEPADSGFRLLDPGSTLTRRFS